MIFVLPIPILLNQLYKPIISNGKPSLIKNKKAKDYEAIIKALALKQKIKCLEDVPISLKIDLLRKNKANDIDCDGILKLLLDSLEGICYNNDKQICEITIRKHLFQNENKIVLSCEKINDEVLKKYYAKKIKPAASRRNSKTV